MKCSDFYRKSTSLRESTSSEPFCAKIGWGWAGKKSESHARLP